MPKSRSGKKKPVSCKREKAFALWLACHTQEEIAEAVEVASIQTISNWCDDFSKKLADDNLEKWNDFTPPIYNVWKRQADRDARKAKIKDLYLKAYTAEEIGEEVGLSPQKLELTNLLEDFLKSSKVHFSDEDFKPPIYNVWTFATIKKAGSRGQGGRQIKHNEPGYYCMKPV